MSTNEMMSSKANRAGLITVRKFGAKQVLILVAVVALVLVCSPVATAQANSASAREVRTIYPSEWEVPYPVGLAYATGSDQLFLIDLGTGDAAERTSTTVVLITPYEDWVASVQLPFVLDDAINMTLDNAGNRLLLLSESRLASFTLGGDGVPSATPAYTDSSHLHIQSAGGLAVDPTGTRLFVLDSAASLVISADLKDNLAELTKVDLSFLEAGPLRGIAVHPITHNLFIVSPTQQTLYELTQAGKLVRAVDLSDLALIGPGGLVFGPSADLTDPAETLHLFMVDSNVPDMSATDTRPHTGSGGSDHHPMKHLRNGRLRDPVPPMSDAATPVYGKLVEIALTPGRTPQERCGGHAHSFAAQGDAQVTQSPAHSTPETRTVGR